jgi:hypothetical protein
LIDRTILAVMDGLETATLAHSGCSTGGGEMVRDEECGA